MKITLTGEESLSIESTGGQLTIEAPNAGLQYSPFHMLASALGTCTFSVVQSWAANKNLVADDLKVGVSWKFVEGQHRVGSMKVRLDWASLSPELWPRAVRAAGLCGVHQTLTHPIQITIDAPGAQSPAMEASA